MCYVCFFLCEGLSTHGRLSAPGCRVHLTRHILKHMRVYAEGSDLQEGSHPTPPSRPEWSSGRPSPPTSSLNPMRKRFFGYMRAPTTMGALAGLMLVSEVVALELAEEDIIPKEGLLARLAVQGKVLQCGVMCQAPGKARPWSSVGIVLTKVTPTSCTNTKPTPCTPPARRTGRRASPSPTRVRAVVVPVLLALFVGRGRRPHLRKPIRGVFREDRNLKSMAGCFLWPRSSSPDAGAIPTRMAVTSRSMRQFTGSTTSSPGVPCCAAAPPETRRCACP